MRMDSAAYKHLAEKHVHSNTSFTGHELHVTIVLKEKTGNVTQHITVLAQTLHVKSAEGKRIQHLYSITSRMSQLQRRCSCHRQSRRKPIAIGHRLSLHQQTLTCDQPYAALVYRLTVSTPVIHKITWITTHFPTSEGWKAEMNRIQNLKKNRRRFQMQ